MTATVAWLTRFAPDNAVRVLGHHTHSHPVPHLVHVVTGTAHLEVDGDPVVLRAQESLWLAPDVPHAAKCDAGSLVLGPFLHAKDSPPTRVHRLGVVPALVEVMSAALAIAPTTCEQIDHVRTAIGEVLRDLRTSQFFGEETGLPFNRWRVQARLNVAISRLRAGVSVERAARASGYATRSGLVKALTRELDPDALRTLLG